MKSIRILRAMAVAATLGHSPAECLASYAGWWPSEHDTIRAAMARAWSSDATGSANSAGVN